MAGGGCQSAQAGREYCDQTDTAGTAGPLTTPATLEKKFKSRDKEMEKTGGPLGAH